MQQDTGDKIEGEFNMEEIRTFNFINSIKGGCGKTTFSLLLSDYLSSIGINKGKPEKRQKNSEKCLIFDMDLQGTAMQYLFKGNLQESEDIKYLNDAIRDCKSPNEYITINTLTDGTVINTIFSNPTITEKEKYRVSAQGSYSPVVKHNVFRDGLKEFLKKFEGLPQRHFIFDMPPNSDGFSDAAMECLLNRRHSIAKKEDRINLFYVLGLDNSQINPTIDEIKNLLERKDIKEFTNIYIIFNENIPLNFQISDDFDDKGEKEINLKNMCDLKKNEMCTKLNCLKENNKIHFGVVGKKEIYANWCFRGKGLCSWNSPNELFSDTPINMYAEYIDKEFVEIEKKKDNEKFRYSLFGIELK